ncbi:MAG TPA: OmpH family outer membrane protein [Spirochaetales bacterium]|nr:OmpH family outer membrane protein [Spirochaetales bacterium]
MNARRTSILVLSALLAAGTLAAQQQQMGRVAVVDLQKVYMTYAKDSAPVRAFEEEKARVQTEVDRMTTEIRELQRKKAEAIAVDDKPLIASIDAEIGRKALNLSEYYKIKKTELDEKAKKLSDSSEFSGLAAAAIKKVAELEGYSLVISAQQLDGSGNAVLWFSPTIDISDKVIFELVGKAK